MFDTNNTIDIESPAATKIFLSDLKYSCLPLDKDLAQLKAMVCFDPKNKKLISLAAICDSVECYPEDKIKNEYDDLTKNLDNNHEHETQQKQECTIM